MVAIAIPVGLEIISRISERYQSGVITKKFNRQWQFRTLPPLAIASQPDTILLDVMMPDLDGAATFAKLQENPDTSSIPVILLTAKAQVADQRRFTKLGVKALFLKPFDPVTLPAQISKILHW